jgi:hypothetical protein
MEAPTGAGAFMNGKGSPGAGRGPRDDVLLEGRLTRLEVGQHTLSDHMRELRADLRMLIGIVVTSNLGILALLFKLISN